VQRVVDLHVPKSQLCADRRSRQRIHVIAITLHSLTSNVSSTSESVYAADNSCNVAKHNSCGTK
jgi:hypothetical protein